MGRPNENKGSTPKIAKTPEEQDAIRRAVKARQNRQKRQPRSGQVMTPDPVSNDQLGVEDAYRHHLVTQHPKNSTERKAAKLFIKIYGETGYMLKLKKFDDRLAVLICKQLRNPQCRGTINGIADAWIALRKTYTGVKAPEEVEAKVKVEATIRPQTTRRRVQHGDHVLAMRRMVGAPVRTSVGSHIVLSDS